MSCKIKGCDKSGKLSLGWCNMHYTRFRRHGDPLVVNKLPPKVKNMYRRYNSMVQRCHNPNDWAYKDYGARGIKVCERWLSNKEQYVNDMGFPPSKKHSIDREDNDKGYSPENCRWVLRDVQVHNQRGRSATGFRGVYEFQGKFRTQISRGRTKLYQGGFNTPEEAYSIYLKFKEQLYGY